MMDFIKTLIIYTIAAAIGMFVTTAILMLSISAILRLLS